MNRFDHLPLEIIREHIFPYLDYDGRNAVNQTLLPKWDYIRTPLIKDKIIIVHMSIIAQILKRNMTSIEKSKTLVGHARAILKLLRNLEKYPLILRYSLKFRNVVINKCKTWSVCSTDTETYQGYSLGFIKNLSRLSNNILKLVNTTHTYIKSLSVYICEDWSAINKSYVCYTPDLLTTKRFWTD